MATSHIIAYVGLGANLGQAADTLRAAITQLGELPETRLQAQSSLFQSAPIDAAGDDYINAVVELQTSLSAEALLQHLQAIEQAFGRERPYYHAPRTLDLDLLLYGQQQIQLPHLTVPHPGITARAFVLIPLLQLDPFIHIPGKGAAHQFAPAVSEQKIQKI